MSATLTVKKVDQKLVYLQIMVDFTLLVQKLKEVGQCYACLSLNVLVHTEEQFFFRTGQLVQIILIFRKVIPYINIWYTGTSQSFHPHVNISFPVS